MLVELALMVKLIKSISEMRDDGVPYATIDAELGLDNRTPFSAYRIMRMSVARKIVQVLAL